MFTVDDVVQDLSSRAVYEIVGTFDEIVAPGEIERVCICQPVGSRDLSLRVVRLATDLQLMEVSGNLRRESEKGWICV